MDNYDVVIERTVRDLFRSSPLLQIKKFKINKEKEILKKDEELRDLILEKYPILIKSISSLEQISSSLNDLQEIRKKFGENVDNMERNLENENVYQFRESLFKTEDDNDDHDDEDLEFNISEEIDECWKIINTFNTCNTYGVCGSSFNKKDFDILLLSLITIKRKLNVMNNLYVPTPVHSNQFLKDNFDFILVDFMEILMKEIVSKKLYDNYNDKDNNNSNLNLEKCFLYFYGIYSLLYNKEKLNLSEFYYKLENDEKINDTLNNIFSNITNTNLNAVNNQNSSLIKTLNLIIKLILLKLSKNFNFLNSSLSYIKVEEAKVSLVNNIIDIFMNTYLIINIIHNIFIEYTECNNNSNEDSDSDEEIKNFKRINNFPIEEVHFSHEQNICFNIKNISSQIKIIFSDLNNGNNNFNIITSAEREGDIDENFQTDYSQIIQKFILFIKEELNKNLKSAGEYISSSSNNNDYTQVISVWQSSYLCVKKLFVFNQDNNRNRRTYNQSKFFEFINDLLKLNPQVEQIEETNLNKNNDEENSNNSYNANEEILQLLFNFIFIDKSLEQIKNIITKEFNNLQYENFSQATTPPILSIITEVYNLSLNTNINATNKIFIEKIILLLKTHLFSFLENCINKINKITSSIKEIEIGDLYINFIVNIFCDKNLKLFLHKLNFENSLELINILSSLFLKNKFNVIDNYMKTVRKYLELENFNDDDCYLIKSAAKFQNSHSVLELSKFLNQNYNFDHLDFDDDNLSKDDIKLKIFEIVTNNYCEELDLIKIENVFNKRIFNDLCLFNKIIKTLDYSEEGTINDKDKMCENIKNKINNLLPKQFQNNEEKCDIINLSENNFYLFFTNNNTNPNAKDEKKKKLLDSFYTCYNPNNETTTTITASHKLKETFNFHPRLNTFMILKNDTNKQPKTTTEKYKQNTNPNINSTSKLLDLRIDENYLSIKSKKSELNLPSNQNTNITGKSSNTNLTNILPNEITKYSTGTPSVTTGTGKTTNKSASATNINPPLTTTTTNPPRPSLRSNPLQNKETIPTPTLTNQPNLKNYLGYFGGMLKENLSNITGYYNPNSNANTNTNTNVNPNPNLNK